MEKFIQEGELLLLHYEWAGGIIPKRPVIIKRKKLVSEGKAAIVKPEDWFDKKKPKSVKRK